MNHRHVEPAWADAGRTDRSGNPGHHPARAGHPARRAPRRADGLEVVITPTYSGCPAMGQIEDDVRGHACSRAGIAARVVTQLAPAWTDRLDDRGRARKSCAPTASPRRIRQRAAWRRQRRPLHAHRAAKPEVVPCPHCGSSHTPETSHFGSTACKALYKCLDCQEPFDYFKPY